MSQIDPKSKLTEPPEYVPSVDQIFLKELSDTDRFLVLKLDEISQRLAWLVSLGVLNHNLRISLESEIEKLRKEVDELRKLVPGKEDQSLVTWVRENLVSPAKMVGWLVTATIGALLLALMDYLFHK